MSERDCGVSHCKREEGNVFGGVQSTRISSGNANDPIFGLAFGDGRNQRYAGALTIFASLSIAVRLSVRSGFQCLGDKRTAMREDGFRSLGES